jgi:hypothetical protein
MTISNGELFSKTVTERRRLHKKRHWKTKAAQACPLGLHKNRNWKTKACTTKHSWYNPVTSQERMRPECLQPPNHLIDGLQLLGAKKHHDNHAFEIESLEN